MADPLSFAASLAGIVSLSASVFQTVTKFIRTAKDAQAKTKELATKLRNLSGVLQNLALLASSLEDDETEFSFRAHHIDACRHTLLDIERRLRKAQDDFDGGKAKTIARSLKWPFSADQTQQLVADLAGQQATIQLALAADTFNTMMKCLSKQDEIIEAVQVLDRKLTIEHRAKMSERRKEIVNFFLKANPQTNFETCLDLRKPLTGLWLTQSNETFRKWKDIPNSRLWLSGIPGAGKTILSGAVIEEVLQESSLSTAVAFFFCDYKSSASQEPVNIMAALATQLALQSDEAFGILESYYDELHPRSRLPCPPRTTDLMEIIAEVVEMFSKTFIVIDGLDECGDNVVEVVESLKQLVDNSQTISIAMFSRKEEDIRSELADDFAHIEIEAHTEDLELYVLGEVTKRRPLRGLETRNPSLLEDIRQTLISDANGMFRWVACQIDYLCELSNDKERREALRKLPPTLFETYDRILNRVLLCPPSVQQVVRKVLHWSDVEIMTTEELQEAISIPDDADHIEKEDLVAGPDILRWCSSLIRERPGGYQFAHFTVKEYLESIDPGSRLALFRFSERDAYCSLFVTSLRFLTFSIFERRPVIVAETELAESSKRNEAHPFYPRAAKIFASAYCADEEEGWILEELDDAASRKYWKQLFAPEKPGIFLSFVIELAYGRHTRSYDTKDASATIISLISFVLSPSFVPLHVASMLAYPVVSAELLANGADPNALASGAALSPLHAALLGFDFLVVGVDTSYNPKYHVSSRSHHALAGTLEILLKHGADTSIDLQGASVLRMAFAIVENEINGEAIVPFVRLSTTIADDAIDAFNRQLLEGQEKSQFVPFRRKCLEIASTLDKDPQWARLLSLMRVDEMVQTDSLSQMSTSQNWMTLISDEDFPRAVRLIIERNLSEDLSTLTTDARFAGEGVRLEFQQSSLLHTAVDAQATASLEVLLRCGISPNITNNDMWTALHSCCKGGNVEIANKLLDYGATIDLKTTVGEICWHVAAKHGAVDILKVLYERDENCNKSLATLSKVGKTPVASAVTAGEVEASLLILQYCPKDEKYFRFEGSLLHAAAWAGSNELFRQLQSIDMLFPSTFIDGSTPLHYLQPNAEASLVEHLLSIYDTGHIDHNGMAPLEYLLLRWVKSGDVAPNKRPTPMNLYMLERLLPSEHIIRRPGAKEEHIWNSYCELVVARYGLLCSHYSDEDSDDDKPNCGESIFIDTLRILIRKDVVRSYEDWHEEPAFLPAIRSLLARPVIAIKCRWTLTLLTTVLQSSRMAQSLQEHEESYELFKRCIRSRNIQLCRKLVDLGLDVHRRGKRNSTSAIQIACSMGDWDIFQVVLNGTASHRLIEQDPVSGKCLIHFVFDDRRPSAQHKAMDMVKRAISAGAQFKPSRTDLSLLLVDAARRRFWSVVDLLMKHGADPFYRISRSYFSLVEIAITESKLDILKDLTARDDFRLHFPRNTDNVTYNVGNKHVLAHGFSLIHQAVFAKDPKILEYLLDLCLWDDLNITTTQGDTPLHIAAWKGNTDATELLISRGADVNRRNSARLLPINLAFLNSHWDVINMLIQAGSQKGIRYLTGVNLGHLTASSAKREHETLYQLSPSLFFESAIRTEDLPLCRKIVQEGRCSVHDKLDSCECTPLVVALFAGHTSIAMWLFSEGAKADHPVCGKHGQPGLVQLAVYNKLSIPCLKIVLDRTLEANVHWCDWGLSPLHIAVLQENNDALELILNHVRGHALQYKNIVNSSLQIEQKQLNSDQTMMSVLIDQSSLEPLKSYGFFWKDADDFPCGTPLHFAARRGNLRAVKLLLENGSDLNARDLRNHTPLMISAIYGFSNVAQQLIESGAATECRDTWLNTARSMAVEMGHLDTIRVLTNAGEDDRDFENVQGKNYLYQTMDSAHSSIEQVEYFISRGVSPFKQAVDGECAIHRAIRRGRPEMVAYVMNSGLVSQMPTDKNNPFAVWHGGTLKRLLRAIPAGKVGTVLNTQTDYSFSPLYEAVRRGLTAIVVYLLQNGAQIDHEGGTMGTALMLACYKGGIGMVRTLIRNGATLEYTNNEGLYRNAFLAARSHPRLIKWLLVDRFQEQRWISADRFYPEASVKRWSGVKTVSVPLRPKQRRLWNESSFGHYKRLEMIKKSFEGQVIMVSE